MSLKNWSTTADSNTSSPPEGAPENMTLANVNNVMRKIMADVRTLAAEDTIASATTCDLGTKDATFLTVSGTTTITGFGTVSAGIYKFVRFSGALTLTHNATSLILLTAANRTTVAGDIGLYKSEGSGNWREYFYSAIGGYQPLDTQLTTLAGITVQQATDLAAVSTFIGTLLNDSDAATARTTLELATVGQAEAEAGVATTTRAWTAQRVAQAIAALGLGGSAQTWTDVKTTPGRALNTTYTNTTGKPIAVSIQTTNTGIAQAVLTVGGVAVYGTSPGTGTSGFTMVVSAIVPNGATYIASNTNQTLDHWREMTA